MIPSYVIQKPLRKNNKKAKYVVYSDDFEKMKYFETIEESLAWLIENSGNLIIKKSNKLIAFRYLNTTRFGFGADDLTKKYLREIWWANWNEEPL